MGAVNGYSFSLTSPAEGKPLQLVAQKNGKDLGEQFHIAVEKLESRRLITDSNFIAIPLKVQDGAGHESWIKIHKSELTNKFHLANSELEKIDNPKELEHIIMAEVKRAVKLQDSLELSGFKKTFHNFVKFFLGYFALSPTVKAAVKEAIKDKTLNEIADLYVKDTGNVLAAVKMRLLEQNSDAFNLFDDQVISEIIDARLMREANKLLVKEKAPLWEVGKRKELHDLRVVDYLARHPDKATAEHLKKIDMFNLPVVALASIPITDKNLDVMSRLWQDKTEQLYGEGNLDNLNIERDRRGLIKQAHYATKYLEAYHAVPQKVKDHLSPIFNALHKNNRLEKINNFTLQQSPLLKDLNSNDINIKNLQEKQKNYKKNIKPIIDKHLKEYVSEDSVYLVNLFILKNPQLFQQIVRDIQKKSSGFSKDEVSKLLLREIESILIIDYNFTSFQIDKLSKLKFDNNFLELFSENVIKDIQNGQNSPLLSINEQISLMRLNLVLEKQKMNLPISEDEKKSINEFLKNLKDNRELIKSIRSYKPPENNINEILEIVPSFLHPVTLPQKIGPF